MSFAQEFAEWLSRFIDEKGIDTETIIEAEGPSGTNYIPVACLVEAINAAPVNEKKGIRNMIVRIDFRNGDVMHYFKHLAGAIAL